MVQRFRVGLEVQSEVVQRFRGGSEVQVCKCVGGAEMQRCKCADVQMCRGERRCRCVDVQRSYRGVEMLRSPCI